MMATLPMNQHNDVVADHHRFVSMTVGDEILQFDHLEAFAMRVSFEISSGIAMEVAMAVCSSAIIALPVASNLVRWWLNRRSLWKELGNER